MSDQKFIKTIETEFQRYYEKDISSLRGGHPQYGALTNSALIRMQDDFLTAEIKRRSPTTDLNQLSTYQSAEYNKALIQQIFYVLTEGDFNMMSGYDVTNNTFAPQAEFSARAFSKAAKLTLKNAGLLYPATSSDGGYRSRRIW